MASGFPRAASLVIPERKRRGKSSQAGHGQKNCQALAGHIATQVFLSPKSLANIIEVAPFQKHCSIFLGSSIIAPEMDEISFPWRLALARACSPEPTSIFGWQHVWFPKLLRP
jgi:hypothetical protein